MNLSLRTRAAFAVGLGAIFALLGASSGYQRRAYDSYVHMFFADHYRRHWFDVWEPRWYEGFSVTSYPPLCHQLVALLSWPLGYEAAYVVVMAVAMLLLPLATAAATRAFADERSAWMAALVVVLWPTADRTAYDFGQLPTLFAAVLVLFAMRVLDRFLDGGGARRLATFIALVGATTSAHHFSTVFLFGGCVAVGVKHLAFPTSTRARVVGRGAVALVLAGVMLVVAILPFWRLALGAAQAEIPHYSRTAFWLRPHGLEWLEQLALVPLGAACALVVGATACRARDARPLLTLALFALGFALLSFGPATTPLPRLLFRTQWRWLTYDRFHLWASLLLAVLAGATLCRMRSNGWRTLVVLVIVLAPATAVTVAHEAADQAQPRFIENIEPMLRVLRGPEAARYRHLTLGFGDQFCRLDMASDSPNVEGDYHTGRRDPLLRASGIGTLDSCKYLPGGAATLREYLAQARQKNLRWVFVFDEWYVPPVLEAGFELAQVWDNGVTLFENATVPPIADVSRPARGWWDVWWGVVPIACLLLALMGAALERIHAREFFHAFSS